MHCNSEAGFSIIEVLIAVLVLSVGLVSAAAMQTRAVEQTNFANRLSQRVQAGAHWMEDLIARPITVETGETVARIYDDECGAGECSDGSWFEAPEDNRGSCVTTYRVIDNVPTPNFMTVEVRVVPRRVDVPSDQLEDWLERKTISYSYIRSKNWN